ncbi:hypothetical protein HDU67_004560, partial [Dinochytrium kinnereticum]
MVCLTGLEIAKPHHIRVGNWSKAPLSRKQIEYAASDAYVTLHVFDLLEGSERESRDGHRRRRLTLFWSEALGVPEIDFLRKAEEFMKTNGYTNGGKCVVGDRGGIGTKFLFEEGILDVLTADQRRPDVLKEKFWQSFRSLPELQGDS